MIPHRVYLKNFLCHAEQEFRFEDHPVWLLHGPNGVGKSAVFDAMVYAIYGESRRNDARKNSVADVIRHGESSMRVEFDFEVAGQRYQIWRTRARSGQPKQGVNQWTNDRWAPIRDINAPRDLDAWVNRTLGLPYETFVSAVLLRQGAAEKLIDADKDARRELFRSFIDLEPYIRLNEQVVGARAEYSTASRQLRVRLNGLTTVTDDQIAAATTAEGKAEQHVLQSRSVENAARDRLGHARTWEQNEGARIRIQNELDAAADRASHAVDLERQVRQLQALRILVPSLTRVRELQETLTAIQERHQQCLDDQAAASKHHEELCRRVFLARADIETNRLRVTEFDRQIAGAEANRKTLSEEIGRSEKAAELHGKLTKLRGRTFAPDLDHQVTEAEKAVLDAQAAKEAVPHLEVLAVQRAAYRQAGTDASTATTELGSASAELERLQKAVASALEALNIATGGKDQAEQLAAVAKDQCEQAISRRDQFASAAAKPICSECLQPIDAAHAEKERGKLNRAAEDAHGKLSQCAGNVTSAKTAFTTAQSNHRQLVLDCRTAEARRDAAVRALDDARDRTSKTSATFGKALNALDEPFLGRAVAIGEEGFPTADDIALLRTTVKELPARVRLRDGVVQEERDRQQTQRDIQTLVDSVAAVGAPADVTAARDEVARLETAIAELTTNRGNADAARIAAEEQAREIDSQVQGSGNEINRHAGVVARAESQVATARTQRDAAINAVPDSHRAIAMTIPVEEVTSLDGQLDELVNSGAEQQFAAMAEDRTLHAERVKRLTEITALIAGLPTNACKPAKDVEGEVSGAEKATREAEGQLEKSRTNLSTLSRQQSERSETQRLLDQAERNHALHDRLAGLLGPDGIELDLVRGEEGRIIARANDILVRLSTGELRLEPPDPQSSRTFDLSVRRRGCPDPIAVGNLSGGQRFRTAISLALAVCQGAGDAARRLESVIIDEGFGSLDRDGRTAMVAELRDGQNLAQMFKRIIVVSHQEDFAAAFPVGYRFWSENGETRTEPFGPR